VHEIGKLKYDTPKINLQAYTPFFGAYGKQGMIVSLTNNV
jgi:hypothetical protein